MSPEEFIHGVESGAGRQLEAHEREQIELWRKGRDIGHIVSQPGWATVLEMLQQYALDAVKQSLSIAPGDNDRALAAHAVMYALNQLYTNFVEDVDRCITAAKTTPQCLKEGIRTPSPIESVF